MWNWPKGTWKSIIIQLWKAWARPLQAKQVLTPRTPLPDGGGSSWPDRELYIVEMEMGDLLCWHSPLGQAKLSRSTGPQDSWSPGNWPRVDMQEIKKGAEERVTPWTMGPNLNLTFSIAPLSGSSLQLSANPDYTHSIDTHIFHTHILFNLYITHLTFSIRGLVLYSLQKIISLKCNLHTMKVTHLNCIIQWFGRRGVSLLDFATITKIQFYSSSVTSIRSFMSTGGQLLFPTLQAQNQIVICLLIDLPFLDISYEWNHAKCGLLCLTSFQWAWHSSML